MSSTLEREMEIVLKSLKIPFQREYRFRGISGTRRWRFDFVLGDPDVGLKVAIEVEGGIWINGRHTHGGHWFARDCEKYTEAAICSWTVLRYCAHHITTIAPAQLELMWQIYQESASREQIAQEKAKQEQASTSQVGKPRRSAKKKIK